MVQEKRKSWLEELEEEVQYNEDEKKEQQMEAEFVELERKIEENKQERGYWQQYIDWIHENADKMPDANAIVKACQAMQSEVAEKYNALIKQRDTARSELQKIKSLGSFVRWVKGKKGVG